MGMERGSRFRLELIDASDDTSVGAGTNITNTITPPVGKIYQVIDWDVHIPIPGGGGSGSHELHVRTMNGGSTSQNKLYVKTAFGAELSIGGYFEMVGATTESPSGTAPQNLILTGEVWCDHTNPLKFYYKNDADVAQAGTRRMKILVKEYNEL